MFDIRVLKTMKPFLLFDTANTTTEYNEVRGKGFCGDKYRISRKDALKEVYCMKKNARKRNERN